MDESEELSGLEGMLVLTWVSLAVISCTYKQENNNLTALLYIIYINIEEITLDEGRTSFISPFCPSN